MSVNRFGGQVSGQARALLDRKIGMMDPRSRLPTNPTNLPSHSMTNNTVNLLPAQNLRTSGFAGIEELIEARTPTALGLLEAGTNEALRLSDLAAKQRQNVLSPFMGTDALEEQRAILGLAGEEAQEEAIGGIPVSEFDRELQTRQQRGLLRRAAATGDLGSGATIDEGQRLAGTQQAQLIQQRLADLEPLVAAARGVRSTLSGGIESSRARQAGLQAGLGGQQAGIRLGAAAPVIQSRMNQAELSGLSGITRAQQQGQIATSLAGLAGQFF